MGAGVFDAKNVLVSTTLVAKVFVHVASEEQVRTFQVQKGLVKKTRTTTTATATKSARFLPPAQLQLFSQANYLILLLLRLIWEPFWFVHKKGSLLEY